MTFTDRVISITQDTILPKIFDNILTDNFAAFRFVSNGLKWSGSSLKRPIKLVKSTLGGSFAGLDTHSTATTESRRTMEFNLKAYEIPVAIAGLDKLVNATEAQVIDLVKGVDSKVDLRQKEEIKEYLDKNKPKEIVRDINKIS